MNRDLRTVPGELPRADAVLLRRIETEISGVKIKDQQEKRRGRRECEQPREKLYEPMVHSCALLDFGIPHSGQTPDVLPVRLYPHAVQMPACFLRAVRTRISRFPAGAIAKSRTTIQIGITIAPTW